MPRAPPLIRNTGIKCEWSHLPGALSNRLVELLRLLKPLSDPRALELKKRDETAARVRRDPTEMLRLLLSALDA